MGKFDTFFDDAVVNAKAAASAVSKKAVTFYDASKHKISAAEIRGEINKKLKELGKITYKSEVHGTDLFAEKEQLIAEIKELIENLNIINGHIAAIKSQRKCPQCEARVPKNSVFCNICGTKLEEASAEQAVMATAPAADEEIKAEEPAEVVEEAAEDEVLDEVTQEPEAPVEEEALKAVDFEAEAAVEPVQAFEPEKAEGAQDTVVVDDSSDDLFV
ncbi:MAG: zinc ribbon domain-containing protein [Ruminococcus sp.]|nr:zinc ribbon domain-containing protein [Ruminococcus sp.]